MLYPTVKNEKVRHPLHSYLVLGIFLIILIIVMDSVNGGGVGVDTKTDFGCGDMVTRSCTFNENLNCPTGHGLIIGADAITIEGNGYTITGTGDWEGIHNGGYGGWP